MAALSPTVVTNSQLSGKRILIITTGAPTTASDTITLNLSTHGVRTIYSVIPVLEAGQDSLLLGGLTASFSSLDITLKSQAAAGTAATNWASATVRLTCIVD